MIQNDDSLKRPTNKTNIVHAKRFLLVRSRHIQKSGVPWPMRSCLCWLFSIQWSSHSETWQQRPRLWSRLRNVNASWQFLSLISTRAVICQRMLITSLSPARPLMGNKRNARERERVRAGGRPRHNVSSVRHSVSDCGDPGLVTGSHAPTGRYWGPGAGHEEWGMGGGSWELSSVSVRCLEIRNGQSQVWADSLRTPEMLGVMTTDTFQIITQWQIQSDAQKTGDHVNEGWGEESPFSTP